MLQNRQLIRFVADVIQQAFDEAGIDARAAVLNRLADDFLELVAGQAGHQKLRLADRLGQSAKRRAIADKVRAHGQDDPRIARRIPACREKKLHECDRLLAPERFHGAILPLRRFGVTEELFELVNHEDQRLVLEPLDFGNDVDKTPARSPDQMLDAASLEVQNAAIIFRAGRIFESEIMQQVDQALDWAVLG